MTNKATDQQRLAVACSVVYEGRSVWVPPSGPPFFTDRNPAQSMTQEQVSRFREWLAQ